jgi:hypothetical protein
MFSSATRMRKCGWYGEPGRAYFVALPPSADFSASGRPVASPQ